MVVDRLDEEEELLRVFVTEVVAEQRLVDHVAHAKLRNLKIVLCLPPVLAETCRLYSCWEDFPHAPAFLLWIVSPENVHDWGLCTCCSISFLPIPKLRMIVRAVRR